jgi:uncharacterized Zn finger protein
MTKGNVECPQCGTSEVVRGLLSDGRPGSFTPAGLRFWSLTVGTLAVYDRSDPEAPPSNGIAHACTACGLVWTHVDPERLRAVLRGAEPR